MIRRKQSDELGRDTVIGLLGLLLFVCLVAPITLFLAVYPLGDSWPDDATACQMQAEESVRGDVLVDQNTPAEAKRTWFPPRIVCSVDVHRDGKPEVTVHQNSVASVLLVLEFGVAAAVCIRLIAAAEHHWRRRRLA